MDLQTQLGPCHPSLFYNNNIVFHELMFTDQMKFNYWRNAAFCTVCISNWQIYIILRFQHSVLIGPLIQVTTKPCFQLLWCKHKQHTDSSCSTLSTRSYCYNERQQSTTRYCCIVPTYNYVIWAYACITSENYISLKNCMVCMTL